ncbi:MAG: YhcH/YjgK/YiaL family protein [Opitutae bacterium]|nr:YhcH/YjgK/YiaL family protein [Opitutae bacterium]
MAIFGSLSSVRSQTARNAAFDAAFAYLDEFTRPDSAALARLKAVGVGESKRIDLAGGVYALEQAYMTKPRAQARMESHLKYIDIQVVMEGEELMAVADVARLRVTENQTPAKDMIFYADADVASVLRFGAGEAAVYFPADLHMPGVAIAAPSLVRKIVVKVPVQ